MKLPANWKTSVSGIGGVVMAFIAWLSTLSYDQGGIALIIPLAYKPWVSKIAAIASLALLGWNAIRQKDKSVTGGMVQQTSSGAVADPGTQSLVDATVKASVQSGDASVTPEQRKQANS
jgi:hypothetical protein